MKLRFMWAGALLGLLTCGCLPDKDQPVVQTGVDFEKESLRLMEEVRPQLVGRWMLEQVHIHYQGYNPDQKKLGIKSDTVLRKIATLELGLASPSRFSPPQPRYPEFEGNIEINGKAYPVYFSLLASPERIVNQQGAQAFFLLQYNFPDGSHIPDPEETYLEQIGLMGENFSLELLPKEPVMIWKGLNRGAELIRLRKQ